MTVRKIALIGHSGSGKSTLAAALQRIYHISICDLDNEIERETSMTVSTIFATYGEDHFRKLESEMLRRAIAGHCRIIACGGGTPCQGDNMDYLLSNTDTVYIECAPEVLVNRLLIFGANRPKVAGKSEDEVRMLVRDSIASRERVYSRAKYKFDGSRLETPLQINEAAKYFYQSFLENKSNELRLPS